jgi:hypothetical protein
MRVRRSKYTKRKGYRKYKKHYTRKYGKHIQKQKRLRRQTRRKVGGADNLGPFNFVLPLDDPRFDSIEIQGQGWTYVTKLGSLTSRTNRPEQIIIYKKKVSNENYFIARCIFTQCDTTIPIYKQNIKSKILETQHIVLDANTQQLDTIHKPKVLSFTTTQKDKYRINFTDEDNQKCYSDPNWYPDNEDKSLPAFYIRKFTSRKPVIDASTLKYSSLQLEDGKEAQALVEAQAPAAADAQALVEAQAPAAADAQALVEAQAPAYVETSQMSEKNRILQELMDSINFLQPSIDDIRKMLKVTNDTTCSFLCNPDECDETMLEKLRQKYMEKIKNSNSVSETDDAIEIFFNTLDENLFLILENFYVQSKILTEEKLKELFSQCDQQLSYSLIDPRSTHKNLHGIINMLYKKIRESILKNDSYLQQNLENMQKLLQLLNSMTPENMKILLDLLNSMSPENMQKLLLSLKSMNPENMAQLLELYSFIEKIDDDKFLIHRYPKGKTPFTQRLLINRKHKYATCKSVLELNREVDDFGGTSFIKDKEFEKVVEECESYPPPRLITGGGRRRKTLKKKRLRNSKQK